MREIEKLQISFAASGAMFGVANNGIAYFLLLYYSQVLGLSPFLAGLAMTVSLFFDAFSDPFIGRWSDRLTHKMGRRHPFLIASILPTPVFYYFLWDAPDLNQMELFWYLLCTTICFRLSMSLHMIPFNALVPQLTDDYDNRTRLTTARVASAWFAGLAIAVAMYGWWIADTPDFPDGSGILRKDGYVQAGLFSAIFIFLCLVYSAISTRSYIPLLKKNDVSTEIAAKGVFNFSRTFQSGAVLSLFSCGLLLAAATGVYSALWTYMQSYFWKFDTNQLSIMMASQLLSAIIAFFATPKLTVGREKKDLYLVLGTIAIVVVVGPVCLRTIGGFWPSSGNGLFFTMVLVGIIEVSLFAMMASLFASMTADLTEHRAVETSQREEGLIYSGETFILKVTTGLGVWIAGSILTVLEFPTGALVSEVDTEIVWNLGVLYAVTLAALYLSSLVALSFYGVDRSTHKENVRSLRL